MNQNPHLAAAPAARVRDARAEEAERLVQMVGRLAAHHGDTASLTAADLRRDAFGDTPWIHLLVAEVDGELAGYAALCGVIQLQAGARGADLHHLYVEPGCRGRRVGPALIEACKLRARALSCRYLTVGTRPDNLAAQAFYLSLGFELRPSYPPRFRLSLDD